MDNIGFSENPQTFLETHFKSVHKDEMDDLKLCNKNVHVEGIGFHLHDNHWIGIMITPWFLNLMIIPQSGQPWPELTEGRGKDIVLEFPCGNLKFAPRIDPVIGSHLCCLLASPLNDYKTHDEVVSIAHQVLADLQRIPMKAVEEPVSLSRRSLFTNIAAT